MKAVFFAVLGVIFYSIENSLLDHKLRDYTVPAVMVVLCTTVAALSGAYLLKMNIAGEQIVWPSGWAIPMVIGVGAVLFLADIAYFSAYSVAAGNVYSITICAALLPVFTVVINSIVGGGMPNIHQVFGIILAIGSVMLAAKGS